MGTPHLVLEGVEPLRGELQVQVFAGDKSQELVGQSHGAQAVGQAQLHHWGGKNGGQIPLRSPSKVWGSPPQGSESPETAPKILGLVRVTPK